MDLEKKPEKKRAARNRTLLLQTGEQQGYQERLIALDRLAAPDEIMNKTIHQDLFEALDYLPEQFVDLLFIDPPYNLTKRFNGKTFTRMEHEAYTEWLESWFSKLVRILKPDASVYICGDWRSSHSIYEVASKYLQIHNRITWEREKGRGALANWKNASEDIWFCTKSSSYKFYVDRVKMKRKVVAPYRSADGKPKDWDDDEDGGRYRLTHPSNVWTDLTVPFWSMPENTDHPTQKPEKLLAKIILASSDEQDVVFDPFLGSGTTSVVAKKLNRRYVGIERDETFCCLAEKRLELAENDATIQGYSEGVFWERNSLQEQTRAEKK
ncbi:site-specific DNA-methyltransferase (adenine-specific) [Paenibacillus phyllosphaerae]|uniref:Methyltransferase n=1 Tax=Paenibacillus phyllosphaerae TaxID=274593 RepID=A0A7W5FQ89_9BACL|nr:site-specific DNA-methyltransferase [Paenibacillus phyllosphaerae]MBB3113215.1 site-specific DNA-methyltransferase (adenine-specific) [Paenibacillus phyllosphaerae]